MTTLYTYPSSKDSTYTVPDTVETIVSGAFSSTVYLTELPFLRVSQGCGSVLFHQEKSSEADSPDSLKEIGANTCCDCAQLTDVRLPSGLSYPGQFHRLDTKITTLDFPRASHLSDKGFQGCSSLTDLCVPPNTTSIGQVCLSSGIRQAVIPAAVSELPTDAFSDAASSAQ